MFIGSYFFGIIGASFRWIVHILFCIITKKKSKPFKFIWLGAEYDSPESNVTIEILNNLLGVIIIVALGIILMNKRF